MQPTPPALDTAAARGPPEVLAIPAKRIGYLQPSKVHNGVWSACGEDITEDAGLFAIRNQMKYSGS